MFAPSRLMTADTQRRDSLQSYARMPFFVRCHPHVSLLDRRSNGISDHGVSGSINVPRRFTLLWSGKGRTVGMGSVGWWASSVARLATLAPARCSPMARRRVVVQAAAGPWHLEVPSCHARARGLKTCAPRIARWRIPQAVSHRPEAACCEAAAAA